MATRNSVTEVNENDSIPFPLVDDDASPNNMVNSESANSNQDSNKTASSRLTSSDKLSALPASSPNLNRILRSPGLGQGRAYRRSLDTSSLPSDLESGGGGYGSPYHTWNSRPNGSGPRSNASDGSYGHETPKRVSFDSDRISLPTIQSVRQALSRRNRGGSESVPQSPALRSSAAMDRKDTLDTSQSRSRATSPLRLFQQWSTGLRSHHRDHEDPFVPVDPFRLGEHYFPRLPCFPSAAAADIEISVLASNSLPHHEIQCSASLSRYTTTFSTFMTDTLPRIVYLHVLLRLPALYFSRVARVFEDAEVSKPDIQRMIDASARGRGFAWDFHILDSMRPGNTQVPGTTPNVAAPTPLPFPDDWTPSLVSPALIRFKHSWEAFIDSILREWKTLNVVSALLLSAILTMFQIPSAATDPVIRTAALISLICALMSLSYGCMYIVRFGTMRSMYRASKWAEEARKANTSIFWNVWVLLAMPAVWMSWSMVFFIVSILSFVWRTGSVLDPSEPAPLGVHAIYGPRIVITLLFVIGMVYFVMIVKTLKSYGIQGIPDPRPFSPRVQPDIGEEQRGRRMERTPSTSARRKEEPTSERGRRFEGTEIRLSGVGGLGLVGMPVRDAEVEFDKEVEEKGNNTVGP